MPTTYKYILSTTLGSNQTTVTFTNISAAYTDISIIGFVRDNASGNYSTAMDMVIGGDTTSGSYISRGMWGNSSSTSATNQTTNGYAYQVFYSPSTNATGIYGTNEIYISNYLSAGVKTGYIFSGTANAASNGGINYTVQGYSGTKTANTISLTPEGGGQFVTGTTFYIYGIYASTNTSSPSTPTIGTATAGVQSASITFTPTSAAGIDAGYTMVSTPDSITASGNSSPITVTGLTGGTAYTFQVKAVNPGSESALSAASNSITALSPAYESIASATGTGSSGTITFTSIPTTYTHLQIRYVAFGTSGGTDIWGRFNSDSSTIYPKHRLLGNGTVISATSNTGQTFYTAGNDATGISSSTFPEVCVIDIHDYANTSKYKTVRIFNGIDQNGSGSVALYSGLWQSTSAITSMNFTLGAGSFTSNTTFSLYGIKS